MSTDLVYLSARDALVAFRAKHLSPVEYLEALIERVEACEPDLNAVIDRRYDEARAEARAAADRYAGDGASARQLEGVAVAVKEEQPMTGRSWAQGSVALRELVATEDHPVVERIQAAGGIVHIRTATPEFSCAPFCHSPLWGITRNPWNLDYSPGGSSGGSGAALAAGYAPLATGSDIGGSIRIPASLSGVVGLKPTWARVPALPPYNLDQYCHDGPMARMVADCALLEDVLAGRDWRDAAAMPDPPMVSGAGDDAASLRVALCVRLGDWPLDDGVEENTRAVAEALATAGADVEEVTLPWTTERLWATALAHFKGIMGAGLLDLQRAHGAVLADYTHDFVARTMGAKMTFYEGLEAEGELWTALGEVFTRHALVLCPTMATQGYVAGESYVEGMHVGGSFTTDHIGAMTIPFNVFSRCPVLSVPSGRAPNGVPTGVQVVARPYDDVTAFRAAAAVEAVMAARGIGFGSPTWRPAAVPA